MMLVFFSNNETTVDLSGEKNECSFSSCKNGFITRFQATHFSQCVLIHENRLPCLLRGSQKKSLLITLTIKYKS